MQLKEKNLEIATGRNVSDFGMTKTAFSKTQRPRGLRSRSAAASLMRLWVRIPPRTWMFFVSVVCCQVEVSATS
jgi:hypothetical protein